MTRPRKITNRFGDVYRVWRLGQAKVVESKSIAGVAIPKHYFVAIVGQNGDRIVSRHRKRTAAMRALRRFVTVER